jgi:5-carboxymethyl-2-hydroxymuconate isomerase
LPHLLVEYSANIEPRLDLEGLLDKLHETAIATGVFPLGGVRIRAYPVRHYRVADKHPDNAFVHVTALIGHGRTLEVQQRAGEAIFSTLKEHLAPLFASAPLAISFYIQEAHPVLSWKHNNLHRYVQERAAAGSTDKDHV